MNITSNAQVSVYETDTLLNQYLNFHYGNQRDQLPFSFGPHDALDFPVRCVTECIDLKKLTKKSKALEIGCAVGRTSFELSRYCANVTAMDASQKFIDAAKHIQTEGYLNYLLKEEGMQMSERTALRPITAIPQNVNFICSDVKMLEPSMYDVVIAANVLCRLPDPLEFLKSLHEFVAPQGQLVLISPYSWLEEFTSKSKWLKPTEGKELLNTIQDELRGSFVLKRSFDMPFLLRQHLRKYEFGVSQASIWERK